MNESTNKKNIKFIFLPVFIVAGIGLYYFYQDYNGDSLNINANASEIVGNNITANVSVAGKNIKYKKTILKVDGVNFDTFISDTAELQQQGLSDWSTLLPNQAMLFVFDGDGKYPFWMKGMNFTIDIVWLDKDYNIVHTEKALNPETYPKSFYPKVPARYVLELPAGTIKDNSVILK